jgi:tagatose-1,6-bisphosphate aldolase non-catalytic subunit AgaZ/GatZ
MITLNEIIEKIFKKKYRVTLLGIGPMSKLVIRAAVEIADKYDFPLFLIASRNQIDAKEFGGGYVGGWDQEEFVKVIRKEKERIKTSIPIFICRDHGGPWQRDEEFKEKISEKQALEKAKFSYLRDILAGFNVLHIDPTKDPHYEGVLPKELVIERIVKIVEYIEKQRKKYKIPPVSYEVGTEETTGKITDKREFEKFIILLFKELKKRNIPPPSFIVAQTGTKVMMRKNVGEFRKNEAKILSSIAQRYGLALKEHNADYLSKDILKIHPSLKIIGANVAPEFAAKETETLLRLARLENEILKDRKEFSNFYFLLQKKVYESNRWRKWVYPEEEFTEEKIKKNRNKLLEITKVCGHYLFEDREIKKAREKLYKNLKTYKISENPEEEILKEIKKNIKKYIICFNLKGLNRIILDSTHHQ